MNFCALSCWRKREYTMRFPRTNGKALASSHWFWMKRRSSWRADRLWRVTMSWSPTLRRQAALRSSWRSVLRHGPLVTRCSSGHPTIAVELPGIADTCPTMLGFNPWSSWLRCFIVAITYPPHDQCFLKTQWFPFIRPAMKTHFLSGVRLRGRAGWPAMSLKLAKVGRFLKTSCAGFKGDYDAFQLLRDSFINHYIRIPIKQPVYLKVRGVFFVAQFQG